MKEKNPDLDPGGGMTKRFVAISGIVKTHDLMPTDLSSIMQLSCTLDESMRYISRTLESIIQKVNKQFPVLMLTGARQRVKTSLLRQFAGKNRNYVTLDDPVLPSLAREEPKLFLGRFKPPVLIDEIQFCMADDLMPINKDVDAVPISCV